MPPRKKKEEAKGLEVSLWEAADRFRSNMKAVNSWRSVLKAIMYVVLALGLVSCGEAWSESDKEAAIIAAQKAAAGVGSFAVTTVNQEAGTTQPSAYAEIVITIEGDREGATLAFARNLASFGYPMLDVDKDCNGRGYCEGENESLGSDLWIKEGTIRWYPGRPAVLAIAAGTPVLLPSRAPVPPHD